MQRDPVLRRHADHDPLLICRPAFGYGLCEVLELEDRTAMSEMRALSVRQPWAWAICHGKDVENRSRATRHRGLLAIHASKSAPFKEDAEDPRIVDLIAANDFRLDDPPSAQGAVVAAAELTGCHHSSEASECPGPKCSPWAVLGQWHWVISGVRPLAEPVPCRGMLGLWRLPGDVEKAVRAQLGEEDRP